MADTFTPFSQVQETSIQEPNLSTQLLNAYYLFIESFQDTLESYPEVIKVKIKEFVADFARSRTVYGILTPSGITSLAEHIFTVDYHRDFVWKLIVCYFSTLGYDKDFHEKLCETLSFSLDITDKASMDTMEASVLTPEELVDRMVSSVDIKDYLLGNKWIVVLVLIQLNYRRQFEGVNTTIQTMVENV